MNLMEILFPDSVVVEMANYNSPFLTVYQQMNTMVIFIFVIIVTIVFKLSLKSFNTSLSSVKIFSTILLISNSTKTISLS